MHRNFEHFYITLDHVGLFAARPPPICLRCASHHVAQRKTWRDPTSK
jgi:hypothetical protein